ncbi:MAG: hypothetical protein ACUVX8_10605 [Candidatus Zipacnadales bacterium]
MMDRTDEGTEGTKWTWPPWLILLAALWPIFILASYLRLAFVPVLLQFLP